MGNGAVDDIPQVVQAVDDHDQSGEAMDGAGGIKPTPHVDEPLADLPVREFLRQTGERQH